MFKEIYYKRNRSDYKERCRAKKFLRSADEHKDVFTCTKQSDPK